MSLTPMNISIVFTWSIYYVRAGEAYQIIDLEDEELRVIPASDTLLDSMMMRHIPLELETKSRPKTKSSDSPIVADKFKKQWSKKDNFRDVLRREVLEYVVSGFKAIYKATKEDDSDDVKNYADDNTEDDANKSALFGHLDVMKKVNIFTKSQIEKITQFEKINIISKALLSGEGQESDASNPEEFEFSELAPDIFKNIRKIHNISDSTIRSIFSYENIRNIDISISSGKGGSFFIKPKKGGRMLIKSITKPEYEIIKNVLEDYYSYLLMNPNTYLCPILGVYRLKTQPNSQSSPITILLMRDVLNIDSHDLSEDDKIYVFDLNGSLNGRKTLDDPSEILNYEENYKIHKNLVLKDVDFFQSFRKLDITNKQSEKIISQITEDINFLSQHNFVDYSLLIFIIIKPYADVKSHLPEYKPEEIKRMRAKKRFTSYEHLGAKPQKSTFNPFHANYNTPIEKANKAIDPENEGAAKGKIHTIVRKLSDCIELEKNEKNEFSQDNSKSLLDKTLYLSEVIQQSKREIVGRYENMREEKPILIFKEKYKNKLRIYHVLNMNDINCIKAIEHEEKMRVNNIFKSKYFLIYLFIFFN